MAWWDRELIRKLEDKDMRVLLYRRYVDDIVMVVRNAAAEESDKPRDENDMCFVQERANAIHPPIQVAFDCPSKHENVKMSVLDLEVCSAQ